MITRENYEAFYLDFLEGTLSPEMEKAFLAFLDANPDLQIGEDELPVLDEEVISLSEFDKLLLKKEDDDVVPITAQNVEYFLISQLEGKLKESQKPALERWLNLHPEYLKDKALYAKTVLPKETVTYLQKSELYQETRIIPLWARVSSVAASVILLIGIGSYFTLRSVETTDTNLPQFSKNDTIPAKQKNGKGENTAPTQNNAGESVIRFTPVHTARNHQKDQNLANNDDQPKNNPNDNNDWKDNQPLTNPNGGILPEKPELAAHVTEKGSNEENNGKNDYAYGLMENPIQPITNELSKRLNTVIDFRRSKESQDQESGFYLKIGKFEFLHKKGGKH